MAVAGNPLTKKQRCAPPPSMVTPLPVMVRLENTIGNESLRLIVPLVLTLIVLLPLAMPAWAPLALASKIA